MSLTFAPPLCCTGFSDGYPFLLASDESLADLNGRLTQSIPMNRFRPKYAVHPYF
jgi:uncharacterized protein YcbX